MQTYIFTIMPNENPLGIGSKVILTFESPSLNRAYTRAEAWMAKYMPNVKYRILYVEYKQYIFP